MRVLHVIQELSVGGAERVVVALAEGLAARGHQVAVVAGRSGANEVRTPDFEIPYIARRLTRVPDAVVGLRRVLRRFRPDVVHAHNPTMAVVAAAATRLGAHPPAVVTVHGIADGDLRRAAVMLRLAALPVIACGPGVAVSLEEQHVRVFGTVLNGVAPPPPPADRDCLMSELGLDPRLGLVVCVGRLAPVKNQQLAVRAMASVPDAALVVVGSGPLRDDLRVLARRLGLSERVVLAGERADVRALIGVADAAVLPSRSEGLPLVALETFAARRPLVATAVRGIRELVQDGVHAVLVPPDDVDALAGAVRRVLTDADLAHHLGSAASRLADEHTIERMISRYEAVYAGLRCR